MLTGLQILIIEDQHQDTVSTWAQILYLGNRKDNMLFLDHLERWSTGDLLTLWQNEPRFLSPIGAQSSSV